MWVKKTEQELAKERKGFKPSLIAPITVFISVLLVMIISKITGESKSYYGSKPASFIEFISFLPIILLIAIGLSLLVYLLQLILRINFLKEKEKVVICDKCNNKKVNDGNFNCDCGGSFIIITDMKWIEDEN